MKNSDLAGAPAAAGVLAKGVGQAFLQQVPLSDGSTADFQVERFEPFPVSTRITATDGRSEQVLPLPELAAYRGVNTADPAQTIYVGVTPGQEMTVLVSGGGRPTTAISPASDGVGRTTKDGALRYTVEQPKRSVGEGPFCRTVDLEDSPAGDGTSMAAAAGAKSAKAGYLLELQCAVDVSQALYASFGSDTKSVTQYVANVFAAMNTIYRRDLGVNLSVNNLVIWTAAPPFMANDSSTKLQRYANYCRTNRPYGYSQLSHLLDLSPSSNTISGIASVGGLCGPYGGHGLSLVSRSVGFDLLVVAHEIGHNCGSRHTHCYNPPIDCCADECTALCPDVKSSRGTLMSYCQDVELSFHPRCIDEMRSYLESVPCVAGRAYSGISASQNVRVQAWGTGYQELTYNFALQTVTVSPYAAWTGGVPYTLPGNSQWVGLYHYDYASGRYIQAVYAVRE